MSVPIPRRPATVDAMDRRSQIKAPSFSLAGKPVFFQGPPQLRKATEANLDKTLDELFAGQGSTATLLVTDVALPFNLTLQVTLK